jgi:TolB-like protein
LGFLPFVIHGSWDLSGNFSFRTNSAENCFSKKEPAMKKKLSYCFAFCVLLLPAFPGTAQEAARETFAGSWTAGVERNGAFYRYVLSLREGGSCALRVTGPAGTQETEGFWSWGGGIFKLEARFPNPGLRSIQWTSAAVFGEDNNSFTIMAAPDGSSRDRVRITFFRGAAALSGSAITRSFGVLSQDLPAGARVAVVNIVSGDGEEGAALTDEVTLAFVRARRFTVIERKDIDTALREQNFQLSGNVDDDSAVSIGKFLGATVVITGSVNGAGARKRLVLKALDVGTAEILAMSSEAL